MTKAVLLACFSAGDGQDGFFITSELCIEADAVVRARINRVGPQGGQFHGVLRGLLGEASIAPLVRLGGLDCLELVEEIALERANVAVAGDVGKVVV